MEASVRKRISLIEVLIHVGIWLIVFIIPHYIMAIQEEVGFRIYLFVALRTFFYAAVFYLNYSLLMPLLFFKRKRISYYLTATAMVVAFFFLSEWTLADLTKPHHGPPPEAGIMDEPGETDRVMEERGPHPPPPKWPLAYNNMLTFFMVAGIGFGIRFSKRLLESEQIRKEMDKEKLNAELAWLKSQVHPHFFFNTLNSIYVLTETNSPEAPQAILKLSKLMRYVIYDSESENTLLSKEIEFMNNYIDLMKLRLSPKVKLTVKFPDEFTDIKIPPLLYISFIENAFKYGISFHKPSFVFIEIKVDTKRVDFICQNSIASEMEKLPFNYSGLGLQNVKQRLAKLFPKKHKLSIGEVEGVYIVNLSIQFDS